MIQTLTDTISNRQALLERLDRFNEGYDFYSQSTMDAVMVWPDTVARHCLELAFLYGTNFVPGGLPGFGMPTGDLLEHEGKTYLTMQYAGMLVDAAALYLTRPKETLYREWDEKMESYDARIQTFLQNLQSQNATAFATFGTGYLERPTLWRQNSVGSSYEDLPRREFLEHLAQVQALLQDSEDSTLLQEAQALHAELTPYAELIDFLWSIRKELDRKGHSYIGDGMLGQSSPAASGGCSLYFVGAGEDIKRAVPNHSTLMMAGAEIGTMGANITYISGGSTKGQRQVMMAWKTPFFPRVQELVDGDESLVSLWQELTEAGCPLDRFQEWTKASMEPKRQGIKEVVPSLVSERVLGLVLDMNGEGRTARLRPIVSESVAAAHESLLKENRLEIQRSPIDAVLVKDRDGLYGFHSVFDE
jgi:hypothetical protein